MQRAHHARMVGSWVVTDGNNQFCFIKVVQRHRAFADADRLRQTDAGRLVAHIGAVREVIGAELAGVKLEQICRFVRGAPGGIELNFIGLHAL